VFDVKLHGTTVLENFDIAKEAGGVQKAIEREFPDIAVSDNLLLELVPRDSAAGADRQPTICGIEIRRMP
jgi:hypothetical protein